MQSKSVILKFSVVILGIVILAASGMSAVNGQANFFLQATASVSATAGAGGARSMASTGGATSGSMSGTMSATSVFPPCSASSTGATGSLSTTSTPSSNVGTSTTSTTYLGVQVTNEGNCGVMVAAVAPNSPAAMAGIQPGDIIVAVDCVPLGCISVEFTSSGSVP